VSNSVSYSFYLFVDIYKIYYNAVVFGVIELASKGELELLFLFNLGG